MCQPGQGMCSWSEIWIWAGPTLWTLISNLWHAPWVNRASFEQVLRQAKGSLELVQVGGTLPELKRCAGKKQWVVKGTKGEYFSSLEAAEKVGITSYKVENGIFCQSEECGGVSWLLQLFLKAAARD